MAAQNSSIPGSAVAGLSIPGFLGSILGGLERLVNDAATTLFAALPSNGATIYPTDGSKWPTDGQFRVRVQDRSNPNALGTPEILLVAGGPGPRYDIITRAVERAGDSTVAVNHPSGADTRIILTSAALEQWLIDHGYATVSEASAAAAVLIAAAIDALPPPGLGGSVADGQVAVGTSGAALTSSASASVDATSHRFVAGAGGDSVGVPGVQLVQSPTFDPIATWEGATVGGAGDGTWVRSDGGSIFHAEGGGGQVTQEVPEVPAGNLLILTAHATRYTGTGALYVAVGPLTLAIDVTMLPADATERSFTVETVVPPGTFNWTVSVSCEAAYNGAVGDVRLTSYASVQRFLPPDGDARFKPASVDAFGRFVTAVGLLLRSQDYESIIGFDDTGRPMLRVGTVTYVGISNATGFLSLPTGAQAPLVSFENGYTFDTLPNPGGQFTEVILTDSPVYNQGAPIMSGGGPNIVKAIWDPVHGNWSVVGAIYID